MADTETPETTSPASYRYWIDETVRFADLDPVGHVNNAAISTYFESARVALFHDSGNSPVSGPRSVVIARLTIDFRAELHYPDRIRIGAPQRHPQRPDGPRPRTHQAAPLSVDG